MTIDTKCPGCGQLLRVADEHAGRHAACPTCRTVYVVPLPPAALVAEDAGECWSLQTPEGQRYGPVSKRALDAWLVAGRITADCQLRGDEAAPWRPADEFYPVLRIPGASQPAVPPAVPVPDACAQAAMVMPASAAERDSATALHQVPHRGPLVLTIGVASWVFTCPVFGIMAWVMGTSDLREIRAGRMNPAGAGRTQAGRILGMISTLLGLVALLVGFFLMILLTAISGAP